MNKSKIIGIIVISILLIAAIFTAAYYQNEDTNYKKKDVTSNEEETKPVAIETNYTEETVDLLVEAMNDFSFEFYKQLINDNTENLFFSPYSIFVALAMTYEGARNSTADEMYDVLNFPQNNDTTLCSFGRIYNLLNIEKEYTLHTANALWIRENYPFLSSYLNFIENYYMGKATEIDFTNPEQAAEIINQWVENHTNGKIEDLVPSSAIDPLYTALILTNAIYFKGSWLQQFDPDDTTNSDFEISPGNTVEVPMMSITGEDAVFNYTETTDLQILELPYEGEDLSMLILLPKENNLTSLEQSIDSVNLSLWRESLWARNVNIYIPRFTMETSYTLNDYLKNMGMNIPFTGLADFSGMTGKQDLFISSVLHKAFVEVNEEGTEAAAATAVIMTMNIAPPPELEFNANHPFIFLIQHKETGNILFMGKVYNPL
jgi:serpin B